MLATRRLPLPRVAARRPLGAPAVKLQQDIHQGIDSVVGGTVGVLAEGVGQKLGATKETLSASCADALQGRCLPAVTGLATHVVKVAGTSITGVLKYLINTVRTTGKNVATTAAAAADQTTSAVDPMQLAAAYLQPIQAMIHYYLIPLRGVRGVLTWHDPALSSWLCLILGVLCVTLPLLPWVTIAHLTGLGLLGPHMWIIGTRGRKAAAVAEAEAAASAAVAQRYAAAKTSKEKAALLREEHTRRLYAAAVAQEAEDKYLATLPHASHSKNRKSYGTVISVQSSRVMQDKLAFAPDPQRSAAQSRRLQPAAAKS